MINPGTPKFSLPDNPPKSDDNEDDDDSDLVQQKALQTAKYNPRSADDNQTKTSAGLSGRLTISTAEQFHSTYMILSDCKAVI